LDERLASRRRLYISSWHRTGGFVLRHGAARDGLPVGMMLVGKHYAETTIYRAAHTFEQLGDWRNF